MALIDRKADANMWWIIIGAVIALVVLIILMVMFTSKGKNLELGLMDCENKGGSCTGKFDSDLKCVCQQNPDGSSNGRPSSTFTCPGVSEPAQNAACCCLGTTS